MLGRLDYIKATPGRWLHWEPLNGGLQAHQALRSRYPAARALVWEPTPQRLSEATGRLLPPWWSIRRWLESGTQAFRQGQDRVDLVWANMGLHADPAPQQTLARWHAALSTGGFLMFACLGPDTLKELREVYRAMNWPAPHHDYIDMHDLGDMLGSAGFAEPVMSMERITLTFATPERLLAELRGLGRNWHLRRFQGLRTPRWRSCLHGELARRLTEGPHGSHIALTFELIFGHAFKADEKKPSQPHSTVSIEHMRAMLSQHRRAPPEKEGSKITDNSAP